MTSWIRFLLIINKRYIYNSITYIIGVQNDPQWILSIRKRVHEDDVFKFAYWYFRRFFFWREGQNFKTILWLNHVISPEKIIHNNSKCSIRDILEVLGQKSILGTNNLYIISGDLHFILLCIPLNFYHQDVSFKYHDDNFLSGCF